MVKMLAYQVIDLGNSCPQMLVVYNCMALFIGNANYWYIDIIAMSFSPLKWLINLFNVFFMEVKSSGCVRLRAHNFNCLRIWTARHSSDYPS